MDQHLCKLFLEGNGNAKHLAIPFMAVRKGGL
jgi:hypothetical protein